MPIKANFRLIFFKFTGEPKIKIWEVVIIITGIRNSNSNNTHAMSIISNITVSHHSHTAQIEP